jgi:hypothetical protein
MVQPPAYAFGIRASPAQAATATATYPAPSRIEIPARWLFIVGLVGLGPSAVLRNSAASSWWVAVRGC